MSLLLDTQALLWFATDAQRFRPETLATIYAADRIWVSAVSAYEVTLKHELGKLPVAARLLADLSGYLRSQRFDSLPISLTHAEAAGRLPMAHRDPFDRLLAAQALVENLMIVSTDEAFDQFGVRRLW